MALLSKPGPRNAIPLILLMLVGFAAPLLAVIGFSVVPARTFSLWQLPTLENYVGVFSGTNYISFVYSLVFAALTVIVLALVCYPVALGLVRIFGKWSMFMSLLFTIPLFVSENVRLYGWVLFFIKNGVLLGTLKTLGIEPESWLFTQSIILFGMVYVYLPFMLFPMTLGISMVPKETRDAAFDLGASRWQVFKEVDLPLSMPGITIGFSLLSFVLAVGAIAEAKVLGGQRIIPVTHDIEIAFTYAQNWPMGSALSVMLMLVVGVLVLVVLRRFDLDTILGKK